MADLELGRNFDLISLTGSEKSERETKEEDKTKFSFGGNETCHFRSLSSADQGFSSDIGNNKLSYNPTKMIDSESTQDLMSMDFLESSITSGKRSSPEQFSSQRASTELDMYASLIDGECF